MVKLQTQDKKLLRDDSYNATIEIKCGEGEAHSESVTNGNYTDVLWLLRNTKKDFLISLKQTAIERAKK